MYRDLYVRLLISNGFQFFFITRYAYIPAKNIFDNLEFMECISKGVGLLQLLTISFYVDDTLTIIYNKIHLQQCDLVFKDNAMTAEQYKILEMIPFIISYFDFIFQVSDSTANISAIAKPFQWTVEINIDDIVMRFYFNIVRTLWETHVFISRSLMPTIK